MMAPDVRELVTAYRLARERFVDEYLQAEAAGVLPDEHRPCVLALICARRAEHDLRVLMFGHDSLTGDQ